MSTKNKPNEFYITRVYAAPLRKVWDAWEYLSLSNPSKIIYTQQFVDDQERISRHPMAQTWPETMLTTVDLSTEDLNKTRVTITWEPYGKASKDEIETFKNARGGMTQGWTGSFDKLENYLEGQSELES